MGTSRFRRQSLLALFTNCSIHKPLALGANQCAVSPFCIFDSELGAVRITEVELRKVAVKVGFRAMLVDAGRCRA